jgi:hypothetical protein
MLTDENLYKEIKFDEMHSIKIYDGEEIGTYYKIPEWNEDDEEPEKELCFTYRDREYFFSEIMNIHNEIHNPNPPEWMLEFDGYMSDSYFSGILIKLIDNGEAVKAYTYIS